jgi:O-antigen ligase
VKAFSATILTTFLSLLFLAAAGVFAWTGEPIYLFLPFILLAVLFLLQQPLYLLYVLIGSIPWSVEFNFDNGLGTDLPDEPLMLLTSVAVLIIVVSRKTAVKNSLHPLLFILLLQWTWSLCSVIASTDIVLSVKYLLAKTWYLMAFVAAPVYLLKDKKKIVTAGLVLVCSMTLFMFIALVRHAGNGWTFEKINDSLAPFFHNHVNYSALLVFMVPIQLAVIRLTRLKWVKNISRVILVITVGALYFSYARGAWLALITGLCAYLLIKKRLLLWSYIFFFAVCIAAVLYVSKNDRYLQFSNDYKSTIFHTDFQEHLIATYQLKDMSSAERFYRWVAGIRMIKDAGPTGFGPTTFYDHYKSYTVPAFKTWVSRNEERSTIHNYFLLLLVEQGVVGMLLFIFLVGALFWYAEKLYHKTTDPFWKVVIATVAAILMMECTVNFLSDMIETDKVGSVFYLCLAVIILTDRNNKGKYEIRNERQ